MVVAATQAGVVHLKDVAEVKDSEKENPLQTRLNGENSVVLVIQKQSDANSVKTSDRLRLAMKEFESDNPGKVKFTVAQDITDFTRNALHEVNRDLFLAILMVALVLFLFLHSVRNSLIVLLAIPTSLVTTFFFMYLLNFTLNLVSLMALALVIGILVDDSIVVLENIYRHMEKGEERVKAAINGRSEIGFAAIAITLVDVVVFLPISLVGGMVGRIFGEFGLTIVVSTLLSLFVSFTLTPMLPAKWSKVTVWSRTSLAGRFIAWIEGKQEQLGESYRNLLTWALDRRKTVLLISSTLLTLVVIPVIYTYVDGLKARLPVLFKRVVWAARVPWKGRPVHIEPDRVEA